MAPHTPVALTLAASLCGALAFGGAVAAPAAAAAPSVRTAQAPARPADIGPLLDAIDELMEKSASGTIDEDALAEVNAKVDVVLGPDPDSAPAKKDTGPASVAETALRDEVDALIKAAAGGDWLRVSTALQAIPKLSNDLLSAAGWQKFLDSLPKLPGLPTLPGLPAVPAVPAIPGLPALPAAPAAIPGLPAVPGVPTVPGLPASPALPAVPAVPEAPAVPAVPGL
ncbi:hypothetical protein [Streptomyces sp. NBC_01465]|uniref:hypothetical protein n=1 Tax=Streptomyces sp. NBC_01465 TaxID=2903878 RepID=UPI002E3577CE|nr:hypothetical protein [Streptomyces sp. NBC_01465]